MENKYNSKQLEEILDEVRACTLLFVTQNGKINCPSAEEYLINIQSIVYQK